jgi:hypothetical protein
VQVQRKQFVISLLLEGNWLPLPSVLVNQVGKYRYNLSSPHDNARVHLIVDVALVSRTKVISIHSPVWLENSTDMELKLQLHVPTSLLTFRREADRGDDRGVLPSESSASSSEPNVDENGRPRRDGGYLLRPLPAGRGRYLPLSAMLEGVLSLTPSGLPFLQPKDLLCL